MKTRSINRIKIFSLLILTVLFLTTSDALAKPPKWAPAHGYRAKTRYIYFPQHNFYYDLQRSAYFYINNGGWSMSVSIPTPFININLGVSRQIQLDYVGAYPYYYNSDHCVRYKEVKVKKAKPRIIVIDNDHHRGGHEVYYEKVKYKGGHGRGHGHDRGGHGKGGHGKH